MKTIKSISTTLFAVLFLFTANLFAQDDDTLFDTINEHSELMAFTSVMTDVGMDSFLHHEGPFTVLAPVNDAFEELGSEKMTEVLSDVEMQRLVAQNHVFQGNHSAEDIEHIIPGEVIDVITTSNGTVIVIDEVILETE